jgi:uncharacterized RDD family membrane protein YckC
VSSYPPPPDPWSNDVYGRDHGRESAPGDKGYTPFGPAARWWSRVGATLVDALVLIVPNFVVDLLAGRAVGSLITSLLQAAYVIVLLGTQSRTIGNRAAGTTVVDTNGQPLTMWRSFIRWLSMAIMAAPVLVGAFVGGALFVLVLIPLIDDLWPLWDRKNQTLHDKMAGTYVLAAG